MEQENNKNDTPWKYREHETLDDVYSYVMSTYCEHYSSEESNLQPLDLINALGDSKAFCRSTAIKYLSRFDKKGQGKKDILKAIHYCILLYYFSGFHNEK